MPSNNNPDTSLRYISQEEALQFARENPDALTPAQAAGKRAYFKVKALPKAPSVMTKADLTPEVRAQIAAQAQQRLDAAPNTASRDFEVTIGQGDDARTVRVKGISAADPVITDGERFAMISKREDGPSAHAGGMKDTLPNGQVETPTQTALREAAEELGFKPKPDQIKVEVMGKPQANANDIRFYDPEGTLAKNYGLKPGDLFIMDSVGVKITSQVPLTDMEVVPKGQVLTEAQLRAQAEGRLLQAGSDALEVRIVNAKDAAGLHAAGKIAAGHMHYDMMHQALPDAVPARAVAAAPLAPSAPLAAATETAAPKPVAPIEPPVNGSRIGGVVKGVAVGGALFGTGLAGYTAYQGGSGKEVGEAFTKAFLGETFKRSEGNEGIYTPTESFRPAEGALTALEIGTLGIAVPINTVLTRPLMRAAGYDIEPSMLEDGSVQKVMKALPAKATPEMPAGVQQLIAQLDAVWSSKVKTGRSNSKVDGPETAKLQQQFEATFKKEGAVVD